MPGPQASPDAMQVGQHAVPLRHPELLIEPSGMIVRQKMA
jgi:hypothetical protein